MTPCLKEKATGATTLPAAPPDAQRTAAGPHGRGPPICAGFLSQAGGDKGIPLGIAGNLWACDLQGPQLTVANFRQAKGVLE